MRITRNQLRKIIIEQIRQGGPEDLWAAEERRPESTRDSDGDGRSDKEELYGIADAMAGQMSPTPYDQDWFEKKRVSDKFKIEMKKLFSDDPGAFEDEWGIRSTEEEWTEQIKNAQQELERHLEGSDSVDEFPQIVDDIENRLHTGDFRPGPWGGPER
jgi:hypothetical protein